MDINKVYFLALRILDGNNTKSKYYMPKNLKVGQYYKFYDGLEIDGSTIIFHDSVPEYLYNLGQNKPSMNVCAIVGENGSGKSTLIEYVMRIINNLSCYILGEDYRNPGAEHLHYINDVYAELYVRIYNCIFQITCEENIISVKQFIYYDVDKYKTSSESSAMNFTAIIDEKTALNGDNNKLKLLQSFCYTIIVNYSFYAFCPADYPSELTNTDKEIAIRRKGINAGYKVDSYHDLLDYDRKLRNKNSTKDGRCWLQGLFYKNDGYQVPLVITPMREYGNLDMQKEYKLAKERLMSLLFIHDEGGDRLFKKINGKLEVWGFRLEMDKNHLLRYKNLNKVNKDYLSLKEDPFNELCDIIKEYFADKEEISTDSFDNDNPIWNYIIAKTIRIFFTYPRYSAYRPKLKGLKTSISDEDSNYIKNEMLNELLNDHTHVTRKLLRSIYYLRYKHLNLNKNIEVNKALESLQDILNYKMQNNNNYPKVIEELLPPPFLYVDFILHDNDDKHTNIKFRTLSSGEKQYTFTLTSFFYHLMNIDSVGEYNIKVGDNTPKREKDAPIFPTIEYKHVTVIFDEIELYFHPEMQRTFIAHLIDGLKQMEFRNLQSIQVIFATHSPFILSDIPCCNTLFLKSNGLPEMNKENLQTFGANIHLMLKNSFFLNHGSMGLYAQNIIKKTITKLQLGEFLIEKEEVMNNDSLSQDDKKNKINRIKHKMSYIFGDNHKKEKDFFDNNNMDTKEKISSMNISYVKDFIEIIQEPIVKMTIEKQFKPLKKYVDIENG